MFWFFLFSQKTNTTLVFCNLLNYLVKLTILFYSSWFRALHTLLWFTLHIKVKHWSKINPKLTSMVQLIENNDVKDIKQAFVEIKNKLDLENNFNWKLIWKDRKTNWVWKIIEKWKFIKECSNTLRDNSSTPNTQEACLKHYIIIICA